MRGLMGRRLMGRGPILAVAIVALTVAPACKKKKKAAVVKPVEIQSVVAMGDPALEKQLKLGFYGIEGGSWRWTSHDFVVELAQPPNAATAGAKLHLNFTIPDAVFEKLGPLQLSAQVGAPGTVGLTLDPQKYSKAGTYDYTRDVDAAVFQTKGPIRVEFTCDKSIPPEGNDRRELAVIASSVGLEEKSLAANK